MSNSMLMWGEVNSKANQPKIIILTIGVSGYIQLLLTVLLFTSVQLTWGSVVMILNTFFTGNVFTKTVTLNYGTAKEVFT